MPARRCIMGCESWPDDEAYASCPKCGEATQRNKNFRPTVTDEEAQRARAHADFEMWCEVNGRA